MLASLSDSLFRGKKMNTLLGTIITALVADENAGQTWYEAK